MYLALIIFHQFVLYFDTIYLYISLFFVSLSRILYFFFYALLTVEIWELSETRFSKPLYWSAFGAVPFRCSLGRVVGLGGYLWTWVWRTSRTCLRLMKCLTTKEMKYAIPPLYNNGWFHLYRSVFCFLKHYKLKSISKILPST